MGIPDLAELIQILRPKARPVVPETPVLFDMGKLMKQNPSTKRESWIAIICRRGKGFGVDSLVECDCVYGTQALKVRRIGGVIDDEDAIIMRY